MSDAKYCPRPAPIPEDITVPGEYSVVEAVAATYLMQMDILIPADTDVKEWDNALAGAIDSMRKVGVAAAITKYTPLTDDITVASKIMEQRRVSAR